MTQPIDVAYVELRARGTDEAARDVKKSVDGMESDVDRAAHNMEVYLSTAFKDAADSIEKSVGGISDSINESTRRNRRAVIQMGDDLIEVFDEVEDVIEGAASALGGGAGGGGGGGGGLVSQLSQMGMQLRNISALAPPPLLTALIAALPAIIALGGALFDLGGAFLALPGTIAVLGASIATLMTAFSGFGDAVSALASGDLEKINEAMKNLAPAAQSVAREINALREPFSQLRKEVQQAFFAPLVGDLTALASRVLPTLRGGMRDVAAAFGELGSGLIGSFDGDVIEAFGDIFESTARIIRNISPELIDLFGTLFGVIEHSLPFIERAFNALGNGIQSVSDFLSGSMQTGEFEQFLEDAFQTMGDLFDLAKALFGLLQSIFGNAGDEGRTFIQTLTELTQKMTDFFNSAEGQEVLQKIIDTLPILMSSLEAGITLLGILVLAQNSWLNALHDLGAAVVAAGIAVGNFFQAAWDWVKRAGTAVGDFFVSLGEFAKGVGQSIADAWSAVMGFGGRVVEFVKALPGQILSFLQALPQRLAQLFLDMLNQAAYNVGYGIGLIVAYFRDLPSNLWERLQLLISFVSTAFTTIRDRSIARALELVNSVTTFISNLPEMITNGLSALVERVQSFFSRTRDAGQNRIREMINNVVNFFTGLPGRITGALNTFRSRVVSILSGIATAARDIGRNIIQGVINGIGDMIQGGVNAAKNAARRMVDGFKDALSIGSPSRLMATEVGVPIVQGIGMGIQQGAPTVEQEISTATRSFIPRAVGAQGGAPAAGTGESGTVITFDQGAVQVVFEGVVPTEEEARRTGTAVGQSIAATLQRRNVRTLVRTT